MRRSFLALALVLAASSFGTHAKAQICADDFDDDCPPAADDDASPAVPEPSAAFAMGAGLATIAFALRRRR